MCAACVDSFLMLCSPPLSSISQLGNAVTALGSTMCCFKEHIRFYIFFVFLLLRDKVLASATCSLSDEML